MAVGGASDRPDPPTSAAPDKWVVNDYPAHTMKPPIYVRPLNDAERKTLEAGLRSPDAFTLRRCQILLASADGQNAYQIAHNLGCNPQTARNAIHKVNQEGLQEALRRGSNRPHTVNRSSTRRGPRLCARCFTGAPGSSASQAACGRWRWPRR